MTEVSSRGRRKGLVRLIVATGVVAGLGAFVPVSSSAASCVGPELLLGAADRSESPAASEALVPAVRRGEQLTVSGRWFRAGCADTTAYGPGCHSGSPQDVEQPLTDVTLELMQGGRHTVLGTADATGGGGFAITWTVRIPLDAPLGRATLEAGTAALAVEVSAQ